LHKGLQIDQANNDPMLAADRETLASVLADIGKREEAFDLFQRAATGPNPAIAARCYSRLAILDAAQAESYYEKRWLPRKPLRARTTHAWPPS